MLIGLYLLFNEFSFLRQRRFYTGEIEERNQQSPTSRFVEASLRKRKKTTETDLRKRFTFFGFCFTFSNLIFENGDAA